MSDFNHVYTWAPTVTHSSGLNKKNNEVGAGRNCKIEGFGTIDEVLTQWHENEGFTYTISDLGSLTGGVSRWTVSKTENNQALIEVAFGYNLWCSLFGKILHKLVMRKNY